MKYNINGKEPKMPNLSSKGLECLKHLSAQLSPDMRQSITPMLFPALGAYINNTEFLYPDLTYKEPCGLLGHLIAESGMGKGQLEKICDAILRKFRAHDEAELEKLVEWQKLIKTKGQNKDKPVRPNVSFWYPPCDTTQPAFLQNSINCELADNHTQYYNLPEVEMANNMFGGYRRVSQTIRNIFDRQRVGALRATADGVTGNPIMRVNMNFSSTPLMARNFYKKELHVGTFGRVAFSYKVRKERSGRIPRQGKYDERFYEVLDEYIVKLESCRGKFIIKPLNKLIDQMAEDMASLADLCDDNDIWEMGKRALINAWKDGCILYILNNQTWTHAMGDFVEWLVYHDLWSKMQVFGDMLKNSDNTIDEAKKAGPKNMLDDLPDTFTEQQLQALRVSYDKSSDARHQLSVWTNRGFITYSEETALYTKTEAYLKRRK